MVVVLTPSCSASHLPVFFCSTSTTFNRFKSSIVILFKFNAKVLTIIGITLIKAFFLCFYNEFAAESSLYVLFAWHYSVSVIRNQTAFHHCFLCSLLTEALHLNEHEAACWLKKDEMDSVKWLPADLEVVENLSRYLTMSASQDD